MKQFHITPTPLSGYVWLGIGVAALIIVIIGAAITYVGFKTKHKLYLTLRFLGIIITLGSVGLFAFLAISSWSYNYTRSASYQQKARNLQIEYDNNQSRTLELMNITGEVYFKYSGELSYTKDGNGIQIIDTKTGKKLAVEMGQNDTFIVTDNGLTGAKEYKTPAKSANVR